MKDLSTGALLIKGRSNGSLYEWPQTSSPPQAYATTTLSLNHWHCRLSHPYTRILKKVLSSQSFQVSKSDLFHYYNSCLYNKIHWHPFGVNSLSSTKPLELIYIDVWGPTPIQGFDQSCYYEVFINHFTKYKWFYLLKQKTEVPTMFTKFKNW